MELARGRRAPYVQVGEWILLAKISKNAKLLYQFLAAHVNQERNDGQAWPGRQTLADLLDYTKPESVDPFIKELAKIGAIDIVRRKKADGSNDTNLYVVHETPPVEYAGLLSLRGYYESKRTVDPGGTPEMGGTPGFRGRGTPEMGGEVPPNPGGELDEENKTKKNKTKSAPPERREDVELICAHFNKSLETRGFKPKRISEAWRRNVRLMIDNDGLTPKQIMDCIDWVTSHKFWYKVIMSPEGLRDKYERLRADATDERTPTGPGSYRAYQDPDHSAYFEEL